MSTLPSAESRLAAIVEASEDAIISTDLDGTIRSWNRAAERLLGYSAQEVIGQSIRLIIPADRQAEEDQVLAKIRQGQTVDHFETVRQAKDGTLVFVSLSISPIRSEHGAVIGASKIVRDLTHVQRAERDAFRLASIVDSSEDAIVSKNLDSIVVSWNAAAQRMFGFSAEEIIGKSIRLLIPADRQSEEDDVLARIRRGERVEHFETIRRRQDGTLIPVSLTISPILDHAGTIIGASKIARDISDRQRAEEERDRLLQIAREASRMKDEFLATLSHELRTPLNAILGFVRMIEAGMLTGAKQRRAIDTIARNANSLTQIVEDVLDVSRITSGKVRLELTPVDLSAIVRVAVETARPASEAKGIHVESTIDSGAHVVMGDAERLQQILWNLLSNAVKFTPRGGGISVQVSHVDDTVSVTVRDTGAGIEPEFLPYVFERFRQADATISRAHGGLGLGLAITRHLVELQGGHIFAASAGPGAGAEFWIELPAVTQDAHDARADADADPDRDSVEHPHITIPRLDGVRILAVDDDRDALALMREILEATGATVVTADSGEHALQALARRTPDLLLADLGMPELSGFDLIDQIRKSDVAALRALPAIAVTAYARSEDRAKALSRGFQMHVSKPVDPAQLLATIATLMHRPSEHHTHVHPSDASE